jgi:hypothetical protein
MPGSRLGSEVKERKFCPYGQSGPDWQICSQRLYWLRYSVRFITPALQRSMWIFDIYGDCKVLSFDIGHACTRKYANLQCALYGEWHESSGPKTILKITLPLFNVHGSVPRMNILIYIQQDVRHPQHTQTGSISSTIAAGSSNGVTNTRCCRYSCLWTW